MRFKKYPLSFLLIITLLVMVGAASAQGDLNQTYTSGDGSLTFNYPDGWVTSELLPGFVFVGTSQEVIDKLTAGEEESGLAAGEAVIYVISPSGAGIFGFDPAADARSAVESFVAESGDEETSFGEVNDLTIGDFPAARVTVDSPTIAGIVIAFKPAAETTILTLLATAPGETESTEPVYRAVLEAITYTPPAPPEPVEVGDLTTSYSSTDGRFSILLPEGWIGRESFGQYELFNSAAALEKYETDFFLDAGQVKVTVYTPNDLTAIYETDITDAQTAVTTFALNSGAENPVPTEVSTSVGPAYVVNASADFGGSLMVGISVNGQVLILKVDGGFGLDASIWQDTLLAIAPTLTYRTFTTPEVSATLNWRILQDPGTPFEFNNVSELELGADGTLYALDGSNGVIYTIAADGTYQVLVEAIQGDAYYYGADLAVGADGTFWLTDTSTLAVNHYGADGALLNSVSGQEEPFSYVIEVEASPDGNIYVLDGVENPESEFTTDTRIRVFDSSATLVREFVLDGTDSGTPVDFAVAPDGNLYLTYYSGIQVVDAQGTLLPTRTFLRPGEPDQIEFAPDGTAYIGFDFVDYATDTPVTHRTIVKYGADGLPVAYFGAATADDLTDATPEGQLDGLLDFVVLPDGSIVVSDGYYPYAQIVSASFSQ